MNNIPRCYEKRGQLPEIFPGVPSFMGLPVAKTGTELAGYDAAVMGVPWEGPVTWGKFSGCELSTKTIRDASLRYGGYLPEYNYDLFDYISVCDCGDVPVVPGDVPKTMASIYSRAREVFASGAVPITFGGDHSITVPVFNALVDSTAGKVGLVHLDAHMDNMFSFGEEKFARCSPFHRIYENDKFDAAKLVHMGMRGPRNNPDQIGNALAAGATVITGHEMKTKGIAYALKKALEIVKDGTQAVYVSVCSDILDVAFNPGGPPDFNGLSSFELSSILYGLATEGINGFDFVEIYPPSDPQGVSSHAASWMGIYTLSGMAANKKNGLGAG